MNAQVDPVHGRNYEEHPYRSGLHSVNKGEDDHQEKKSVLNKVKNKAKKVKETLTKHVNSGQDHGHHEEEDESEEKEQPEVHGAPMYESEAARNFNKGQEEKSEQTGANLGNAGTGPLEEDPHAPKDRPEAFSPGNYQTKVTDPTSAGGEEIGVTPILRSFEAMKVIDEPETERKSSTGSHDQFSPDPTPHKTTIIPVDPQSVPESFNARGAQEGTKEQNTNVVNNSSSTMPGTVGAGDYGLKIATSVTEKLAPVYEKVAEAGSAVVTKMQGTNKEGSSGEEVSMKGFFTERLRPGDEDRALSEVITEVIHKKKEEETEKVSDSPKEASGSSEKAEKVTNSGNQSVGMGVVDRLKGAVTSLFGKGSETHASPGSDVQPREGAEVCHENVAEERRLQESVN